MMMSANHLDPDLAAEIYVLDGPPDFSGGPSGSLDGLGPSGSDHAGDDPR
jgi:hypothetical protein